MIVAIDGPAASGKGTLGKRLAAHYGLAHLDTGLLYRAVARAVMDAGASVTDPAAAAHAARELDPAAFDEALLRGRDMGEAASVVAVVPQVRAALLDLQRRFAARPGGAVLDGRDIGTVICPDADVKLFVSASAEARAQRRHRELIGRGESGDYATILADIKRRDARDANRAVAPLVAAADAILLDTSAMGIDDVFRAALSLVDAKLGPSRRR
jgi:CMP/dCMP kinase